MNRLEKEKNYRVKELNKKQKFLNHDKKFGMKIPYLTPSP